MDVNETLFVNPRDTDNITTHYDYIHTTNNYLTKVLNAAGVIVPGVIVPGTVNDFTPFAALPPFNYQLPGGIDATYYAGLNNLYNNYIIPANILKQDYCIVSETQFDELAKKNVYDQFISEYPVLKNDKLKPNSTKNISFSTYISKKRFNEIKTVFVEDIKLPSPNKYIFFYLTIQAPDHFDNTSEPNDGQINMFIYYFCLAYTAIQKSSAVKNLEENIVNQNIVNPYKIGINLKKNIGTKEYSMPLIIYFRQYFFKPPTHTPNPYNLKVGYNAIANIQLRENLLCYRENGDDITMLRCVLPVGFDELTPLISSINDGKIYTEGNLSDNVIEILLEKFEDATEIMKHTPYYDDSFSSYYFFNNKNDHPNTLLKYWIAFFIYLYSPENLKLITFNHLFTRQKQNETLIENIEVSYSAKTPSSVIFAKVTKEPLCMTNGTIIVEEDNSIKLFDIMTIYIVKANFRVIGAALGSLIYNKMCVDTNQLPKNKLTNRIQADYFEIFKRVDIMGKLYFVWDKYLKEKNIHRAKFLVVKEIAHDETEEEESEEALKPAIQIVATTPINGIFTHDLKCDDTFIKGLFFCDKLHDSDYARLMKMNGMIQATATGIRSFLISRIREMFTDFVNTYIVEYNKFIPNTDYNDYVLTNYAAISADIYAKQLPLNNVNPYVVLTPLLIAHLLQLVIVLRGFIKTKPPHNTTFTEPICIFLTFSIRILGWDDNFNGSDYEPTMLKTFIRSLKDFKASNFFHIGTKDNILDLVNNNKPIINNAVPSVPYNNNYHAINMGIAIDGGTVTNRVPAIFLPMIPINITALTVQIIQINYPTVPLIDILPLGIVFSEFKTNYDNYFNVILFDNEYQFNPMKKLHNESIINVETTDNRFNLANIYNAVFHKTLCDFLQYFLLIAPDNPAVNVFQNDIMSCMLMCCFQMMEDPKSLYLSIMGNYLWCPQRRFSFSNTEGFKYTDHCYPAGIVMTGGHILYKKTRKNLKYLKKRKHKYHKTHKNIKKTKNKEIHKVFEGVGGMGTVEIDEDTINLKLKKVIFNINNLLECYGGIQHKIPTVFDIFNFFINLKLSNLAELLSNLAELKIAFNSMYERLLTVEKFTDEFSKEQITRLKEWANIQRAISTSDSKFIMFFINFWEKFYYSFSGKIHEYYEEYMIELDENESIRIHNIKKSCLDFLFSINLDITLLTKSEYYTNLQIAFVLMEYYNYAVYEGLECGIEEYIKNNQTKVVNLLLIEGNLFMTNMLFLESKENISRGDKIIKCELFFNYFKSSETCLDQYDYILRNIGITIPTITEDDYYFDSILADKIAQGYVISQKTINYYRVRQQSLEQTLLQQQQLVQAAQAAHAAAEAEAEAEAEARERAEAEAEVEAEAEPELEAAEERKREEEAEKRERIFSQWIINRKRIKKILEKKTLEKKKKEAEEAKKEEAEVEEAEEAEEEEAEEEKKEEKKKKSKTTAQAAAQAAEARERAEAKREMIEHRRATLKFHTINRHTRLGTTHMDEKNKTPRRRLRHESSKQQTRNKRSNLRSRRGIDPDTPRARVYTSESLVYNN